jgi:hypothetical protein
MTPEDVRRRIILEIAPHSAKEAGGDGDFEAAHANEDLLRDDVLRAIADGDPEPARLAAIALTTTDLHFARWCA